MFLKQLRSEWMRGRGRPVEKYTGAVVLVLGALIPIIMILMSSRNPLMRKSALGTLAFPASVSAARTMASLLGPLWAAAIGANIVGAVLVRAWSWLLVRTSSRTRLLLVKIVTVAVRVVGLTIVGVVTFVAVGALVCAALGAPVIGATATARQLMLPFITIVGAMAFSAAIGLALTVVSRSVVFGMLTGTLALPLLSAIRFKETAWWIPYVHLENLQSRLLTGEPSRTLKILYAFDMSARASAAIVGVELLAIIALAYVVFLRQEIVY
jgi:hypothetical protein